MLEQLTTFYSVGIISNMKATSLLKQRVAISENAFVEMFVWEIPNPLSGRNHLYKYRLALVVNQVCIMRYDNEPGKGDHKHIGEEEFEYNFTTAEKLIEDFWKDVEKLI